VNHIYGTAAVLPALQAIGEDMSATDVRRAASWLLAQQNDDGGWGESCASYMDPEQIGQGLSTASQTAWAIMALLAVSETEYSEAVQTAMTYELSRRLQQGRELQRGFMINYNLYRHYFPLVALGRIRRTLRGSSTTDKWKSG